MVQRYQPISRPQRAVSPPSDDFSDIEELERSLLIDDKDLQEVSRLHPDLLYRVGKLYATELSRRDAAKQSLKETLARASIDLRHAAKAENRKMTENEIEAELTLDNDVKLANGVLLDVSKRLNRYEALLDAFKARGKALDNLTSLFLKNYFSEVSPRTELRNREGDDARQAMARARRDRG